MLWLTCTAAQWFVARDSGTPMLWFTGEYITSHRCIGAVVFRVFTSDFSTIPSCDKGF